MDITVSIVDFRSLSQSDLIMRNLFSLLRIGQTTVPGTGVLVQNAQFHSGTCEDPLILTLKNSQTETVMYVRNIPISAVLGQQGSFEQWVAVYPPGDPQNLHFDVSATPREGQPQVLIRISIQEEINVSGNYNRPAGAISPLTSARVPATFAFSPSARQESNDNVHQARVDDLRRSVDSLQAELAKARKNVHCLGDAQDLDVTRHSSGNDVLTPLPERPGSCFYPSSGSASGRRGHSRDKGGLPMVLVDSTVREKEEQARRIKAHVSKMSAAAKQAQDMTRTLQENFRTLENLRRQFQGLEMQIAEQRANTNHLERDRDQFQAEEAEFKEQIRNREIAEQEMRNNKNGIDLELQKALGERDQQRMSMDTSSSNFNFQTNSLVSDIDSSKREVQSLTSLVKDKKSLVGELELKMRASEDSRTARESAQREEMRAMLDQTRRDLTTARVSLEEQQRRFQSVDLNAQEVNSQLQKTEGEVQYLSDAVQKRDSTSSIEAPSDVQLQLEKKKSDLETHAGKVRALEDKLKQNRQQLSDMSMRIADLHTESHEKELAARRCQDLQAELQRKLDAQQRMKSAAVVEKEAGEGQLNRAEKARAQAKGWWEELEAAVAKDSQQSEVAAGIEKEVADKREKLADARKEIEELLRVCEDLDSTAITRRAVLAERSDALDVAKARVDELSKQLAQATGEIASSDGLQKRLEQDAAECLGNIEEARKRLKKKQDDIAAFQTNAVKEADTEGNKIADLEKTIAVLQADMETTGVPMIQADWKSQDELRNEYTKLMSEKSACEQEVHTLSEENTVILTELQTGNAERTSLEEEFQSRQNDLESTRGQLSSKLREVAELEAAYKRELEQMESDTASLEAQRAEGRRLQEQLSSELQERRQERDQALEAIAKARQAKAVLDSALEKAIAERAESSSRDEDKLKDTEARLKSLTMNVADKTTKTGSSASRLASSEKTRHDLGMKLATITEELASGNDQLQDTLGRLSTKKGELSAIQAKLKEGQTEASLCELAKSRSQSEIEILEAKLQPLQAAAEELESLEQSHSEVCKQLEADGARHKELLQTRTKELDDTRHQIENERTRTLQSKDLEIQTQIVQIDRLENRKGSLTQQVERLSMEKQSLQDSLSKNEKTFDGYVLESKLKAQESGNLQSTVIEMKAVSSQMEEKETELQKVLSSMQTREGLLRSEASESLAKLSDVRRKMETADTQAQQLLEAEIKNLERQRETFIKQKQERDQIGRDIDSLATDESAAKTESDMWSVKTDELNKTFVEAQAKFAEATAERERRQLIMLEHSKKVKLLQEQQRSGANRGSSKTAAQELEEQLQQASDGLADAQELLRRRKTEEEELRQEVQKLRAQIRVTSDKLAYQMEHSDLQFETIQQLEAERQRVEKETEDLTIRLHDAEQRKEYMQNQNQLMQEQVEGLYHVSSNEGAAELQRQKVAAEVARYQDDLEAAKQKVDELKRQKKFQIDRVKKQHQDTCEKLRERISRVQEQIETNEARFRKREENLAKQEQRGMVDAPSSAVPGLVVPQRPLPQHANRRKALLVGINYSNSHAPLKGCINDVWNLQCLLRYTLQFSADQLNLLLDGADGCPPRKECAPTKANILAGLQWLTHGTRPGDSLFFVFCGYGTQHPRSPGADQYEAYLVPSDFAADLPSDFFQSQQHGAHGSSPLRRPSLTNSLTEQEEGPGYRLISFIEIQEILSKLAPTVKMTILFDCCYSIVPNVHPAQNFVMTFPKIERGPDESSKLRDSLSRPRFLQLPILKVRHTPRHLRAANFPGCWLYCFSACNLQEWCAEFPIEGTVQGAFTWAFLKAFAACHFHCSVYQLMRMLTKIMTDLKIHFKRIEQTPTILVSQTAGMNDIVLGT